MGGESTCNLNLMANQKYPGVLLQLFRGSLREVRSQTPMIPINGYLATCLVKLNGEMPPGVPKVGTGTLERRRGMRCSGGWRRRRRLHHRRCWDRIDGAFPRRQRMLESLGSPTKMPEAKREREKKLIHTACVLKRVGKENTTESGLSFK